MRRNVLLAAVAATAAALAAPSAAQAEDLAPIQSKSIAMDGFTGDGFTGVAYYTVEPEAVRLVATVNAGENILRVVSVLAEGQTLLLAVPGPEGGSDTTIEFMRQGDRVHVVETMEVAVR
jgi:hypothetical protein